MAARVGGLLVVLALLLGCATSLPPPASPPAPAAPLTKVEEIRKARCVERGGSFEYVNGRWHCLAR